MPDQIPGTFHPLKVQHSPTKQYRVGGVRVREGMILFAKWPNEDPILATCHIEYVAEGDQLYLEIPKRDASMPAPIDATVPNVAADEIAATEAVQETERRKPPAGIGMLYAWPIAAPVEVEESQRGGGLAGTRRTQFTFDAQALREFLAFRGCAMPDGAVDFDAFVGAPDEAVDEIDPYETPSICATTPENALIVRWTERVAVAPQPATPAAPAPEVAPVAPEPAAPEAIAPPQAEAQPAPAQEPGSTEPTQPTQQ